MEKYRWKNIDGKILLIEYRRKNYDGKILTENLRF